MVDYENTNKERIVNGGLLVKQMARLGIDETHYSLFKFKFDLDEMMKSINPGLCEAAKEVKSYIDNPEPSGMIAYAKKFRSYNQILMIHDMVAQMRCSDGPHQVTKAHGVEIGVTQVYQLQLTEQFCERFNVPHAGIIKLEVPGRSIPNGDQAREIRGRVLKYDEVSHVIQFFIFQRVYIEDQHFIVRFEPSRFVYNSRDFILNNVGDLENRVNFLIFPQPFDDELTRTQYLEQRGKMIGSIKFSNNNFNLEQREAIHAIVMANRMPVRNKSGAILPYIIHGPPGTGKTTTLVEVVRQLMMHQVEPANRILVCTPSNTAADLFATKLLGSGVDPHAVFRMYALMLPVSELKDPLKPCSLVCKTTDNLDMFGIPPVKTLLKYQVIICTMMASTYLILGRMSTQFSHIIIDESGQASELETLVPIVGLIGKETKVVLAGDPRQLGPMDSCDYFKKKGITKSLIERLEAIEFYKDDPRIMTTLRNNYRSHQAIISIPSELFYNNELVTAPDAPSRDRLANWEQLPKKGFPMFWHHVEDPEIRETKGTSYMNQGELTLVVHYVRCVIEELNVKPEDIGIISPYTYQGRRLRQQLKKDYPEITVDTVERFQGSQRRVIIVTTVRSNPQDKLGFMNCEKRFNTTITRAEELLIIVGNAKIMATGFTWARLLLYCRDNGAGIDLPELQMDKEMVESGKRRLEPSDDEDTSDDEGGDEKLNVDNLNDESSSDSDESSSDEDEEEEEEEGNEEAEGEDGDAAGDEVVEAGLVNGPGAGEEGASDVEDEQESGGADGDRQEEEEGEYEGEEGEEVQYEEEQEDDGEYGSVC